MIALKGYEVRHKGNRLVQDIAFEVNNGAALGVVGESGSGKSISVLGALGLIDSKQLVFDGTLELLGESVKVGSANWRELLKKNYGKNIGVIYQDPMTALHPTIKCGEQLRESIHQEISQQERNELVNKALEEVGLDAEAAGKYPFQLSGGQQQRVMIAMATINKPKIIIADEPNTALDKASSEKIGKLIKSIQQSIQASLITISHDIGFVSEMSDQLMVMKSGAAGKYPFQLSGGQQQRVMIAMATINKPKIIIADEPNTALDKASSEKIGKLIKSIQQSIQASLITISHDIGFVSEMSDQLMVMKSGAIVEQGSTEEVLNRPKSLYTQALLACHPSVEKKGQYLPEVQDIMEGRSPELIEAVNTDEDRLLLKDIQPRYKKGKSYFYPLAEALSLRIASGAAVGLVGQSGSGKSSVAKCLIGWSESEGGKLILEDKEYAFPIKSWKDLRQEVQYVFQDPYGSLNPSKRILEQLIRPFVNNGFGNRKQAQQQAELMLSEVGLSASDGKKYPHEFSGGQRQRIVIARALMVSPKVLICDESVSALDLSVQAKILNLLKSLQISRGLSILFISHDQDVVSYFCDEVVELRN